MNNAAFDVDKRLHLALHCIRGNSSTLIEVKHSNALLSCGPISIQVSMSEHKEIDKTSLR